MQSRGVRRGPPSPLPSGSRIIFSDGRHRPPEGPAPPTPSIIHRRLGSTRKSCPIGRHTPSLSQPSGSHLSPRAQGRGERTGLPAPHVLANCFRKKGYPHHSPWESRVLNKALGHRANSQHTSPPEKTGGGDRRSALRWKGSGTAPSPPSRRVGGWSRAGFPSEKKEALSAEIIAGLMSHSQIGCAAGPRALTRAWLSP